MDETELELDLESIADNGIAVARHEGRPVFIPVGVPPFGVIGERVRVRITRDKKSHAFAEIVAIVRESPDRRAPRCQHYGVCGGCHFQHVDYAAQLVYKRAVVVEQLARIGGLRDVEVGETMPSAAQWAYRSHVTLRPNAHGQLGYTGVDGKSHVAIAECPIAQPDLIALARATHAAKGSRARIQIGMDDAGAALGAPILQMGAQDADDDAPFPALDAQNVTYQVRGRSFRVTAGGFFEVSAAAAGVLVDVVRSRIDPGLRVLDLYAGVGLFSAFLAEEADGVTAVEGFAPAAADLRHNLADLANTAVIEGAVERVLRDLIPIYDAAVIDPPRTGIRTEVLDRLLRLAPGRIVYVARDPATLARDARLLTQAGYALIDAQPVDLFPQTYHVETVAAFARA
jgi:23S rRNA (uracil1939-C5)-methyltransferase